MLLYEKLHSPRNEVGVCVPRLALTVPYRWNHPWRTIKLKSGTTSNFVANLECRTAKWRCHEIGQVYPTLPYSTLRTSRPRPTLTHLIQTKKKKFTTTLQSAGMTRNSVCAREKHKISSLENCTFLSLLMAEKNNVGQTFLNLR
jgi:hypothetical protein